MAGHQIENIQPDGVADLSARDPEPHRHRDLVSAGGIIVIKPDCLYTVAGQRYALDRSSHRKSADFSP
jgi:hypothetical protein